MREWILIVILYVLSLGFFHMLGGLQAAGQALQEWGARRSAACSETRSSSS